MKTILNKIIEMPGNYIDSVGRVYFSIDNMKLMLKMFSDETIYIENLLFTPFLINSEENAVYELHYYEFEIEVSNVGESIYNNYPEGNVLPKEIIDNIKPKAIVPIGNAEEYVKGLSEYLYSMERMKFEEVRKSLNLKQYELFFQVY